MTLGEVLDRIDEFDEHDDVIYVEGTPEGASPSTRAAVFPIPEDDDAEPPGAEGMSYVLEVDHAKDVIRVWSEWRGGRQPTTADKCEAVLHYSVNDSYLDLP